MKARVQQLFSSLGFKGEGYNNLIDVILEIVNESDNNQTISKDIKSLPYYFYRDLEIQTIIRKIEFILACIVSSKDEHKRLTVDRFTLDTDCINKKTSGKITVEVKKG